ncbi:MAG: hypothetical protein RQ715_06955 [Methylococcales bacterium]|nr:hypothetical protein [Methylococcales bacterium]
MSQALLSEVLLYSLGINYLILLFWFGLYYRARDLLKAWHGFRLDDATFDRLHYAGMMQYKILIFIFNLTPWLALNLAG